MKLERRKNRTEQVSVIHDLTWGDGEKMLTLLRKDRQPCRPDKGNPTTTDFNQLRDWEGRSEEIYIR